MASMYASLWMQKSPVRSGIGARIREKTAVHVHLGVLDVASDSVQRSVSYLQVRRPEPGVYEWARKQ